MTTNPIFKRDLKLSNKNIRIALAVGIFNFSILMFALSNIDRYISDATLSAQLNYNDFLGLFMILLCIDFAFIFLILPGVTAMSISAERESQSLYLLMATKLKPKDLVTGKLFYAIHTVCLFIISTLPIKLISLIYTTVSFEKLILIIFSYLVTMLYVASIGIFVSSLCKKSSIAIEVVYLVLIALSLLCAYNFENTFLISPISPLLLNLYNISHYNYKLNSFGIYFLDPVNVFSIHNIWMTLVIQLLISLILVLLSIYNTDLRRKSIFSLWKKDK